MAARSPAQAVELDEILVEIETDKVVLEVPAPAAGVLAQIIKNDGDSCIAEEVIAKIDTEGQEAASGERCRSRASRRPSRRPAQGPGVPPEVAPRAATKSEVAMPAAAKLMAEHDLRGRLGPGHRQGRSRHQGRRLEGSARSAAAPAAAPAAQAPAAAPAAAPRAARGARRAAAALSRRADSRSTAIAPSSACR